MRGNNLQAVADREQASRYQLSGDIAVATARRYPTVIWPPDLWAVLSVKYLNDARKRATLGALGIMAGYHVGNEKTMGQ